MPVVVPPSMQSSVLVSSIAQHNQSSNASDLSDFNEFLTTQVEILEPEMYDSYGSTIRDAPGGGTKVMCHLRAGRKRHYTKTGSEVWSSGSLWLIGDVTVPTGSRVLLPDGTEAKLVHVDQPRDETGNVHHTVVFYD